METIGHGDCLAQTRLVEGGMGMLHHPSGIACGFTMTNQKDGHTPLYLILIVVLNRYCPLRNV